MNPDKLMLMVCEKLNRNNIKYNISGKFTVDFEVDNNKYVSKIVKIGDIEGAHIVQIRNLSGDSNDFENFSEMFLSSLKLNE